MCPRKISTVIATARVLMAQLCRKRRSFFVPGCMVFAEQRSDKMLQAGHKNKKRFRWILRRGYCNLIAMKPILLLLAASIGFTAMPAAFAQSPVAPDAKLQKLSGGFAFTEGPTCDKNGNVFFTDQPN